MKTEITDLGSFFPLVVLNKGTKEPAEVEPMLEAKYEGRIVVYIEGNSSNYPKMQRVAQATLFGLISFPTASLAAVALLPIAAISLVKKSTSPLKSCIGFGSTYPLMTYACIKGVFTAEPIN